VDGTTAVTLAWLIRWAIRASLLLVVFALGLRATVADATYVLRQPALVLRGFLAMGVIVPAAAAALAALLDLHPAVEIAMLAMAVGPVPPILPGKQLRLGGQESYVYGLLVAASLAAIVVVPVAIEVLGRAFQRDAHVSPGFVARVVGITVLLPLAAGLAIRSVAPRLAGRLSPWASRIGHALLAIGLLVVVIAAWRDIVSLVGNGTVLVIAAVVAVGLAAGHCLGGPDADDRTALAIAASMRHPGVALAIARLNFPEERLVPAAVLLFIVVNVVVTLPYGVWRRRAHAGSPSAAH
jgi:BASS family bile acid:Na+ symporter